MKKLFIILAIGSLGFAACNSGTEADASGESDANTTELSTDTSSVTSFSDTTVNLDTTSVTAAGGDTTHVH